MNIEYFENTSESGNGPNGGKVYGWDTLNALNNTLLALPQCPFNADGTLKTDWNAVPVWPLPLTAAQQSAADIAVLEVKAEEILQSAVIRRGWANLNRCLTYSGSNATWLADKTAMVAWYDATWSYVFAQEKITPLPSLASLEAGINGLSSNPGW